MYVQSIHEQIPLLNITRVYFHFLPGTLDMKTSNPHNHAIHPIRPWSNQTKQAISLTKSRLKTVLMCNVPCYLHSAYLMGVPPNLPSRLSPTFWRRANLNAPSLWLGLIFLNWTFLMNWNLPLIFSEASQLRKSFFNHTTPFHTWIESKILLKNVPIFDTSVYN